jgi:hypothetical protein
MPVELKGNNSGREGKHVLCACGAETLQRGKCKNKQLDRKEILLKEGKNLHVDERKYFRKGKVSSIYAFVWKGNIPGSERQGVEKEVYAVRGKGNEKFLDRKSGTPW